jgi:hypothetical protein
MAENHADGLQSCAKSVILKRFACIPTEGGIT